MGLLNLFIQNQSGTSTLSNASPPSSGPIHPPTGEFNAGVTPFQQIWNDKNPYLSQFNNILEVENNPQTKTILNGETGLDNTNDLSLPTAPPPPSTSPTPTVLPPHTYMGKFNGASTQFVPLYTPENGYLDNYNNIIKLESNPQSIALTSSGLDNTYQSHAPTTQVVPQTDDITSYPPESTGYLDSAASPFKQVWGPSNKYLKYVESIPVEDQ